MGVNADTRAEPKLDCPEDDLLKFNGCLVQEVGLGFRVEGLGFRAWSLGV